MKTPAKHVLAHFQQLLAKTLSLDAGIEDERARSVASFFTSVDEFIESPLRSRSFLSVSGKKQTILTPAELKQAEILRLKLAIYMKRPCQLQFPPASTADAAVPQCRDSAAGRGKTP